MLYVNMIEDTKGNLVDIEYYCCEAHYIMGAAQSASVGAWPGGMETEDDQVCHHCQTLIAHGLSCDCPHKD